MDVSVHQGTIDWQQVADAGFDFAMIRVGYRGYGTEGNMRGDTQFVNNVQGALDAGLDVGIYYFSQAITVEEARQEAAYVIEQIAPYRITYPVAFDWERQNYAGLGLRPFRTPASCAAWPTPSVRILRRRATRR